jgi:hypothetical protein
MAAPASPHRLKVVATAVLTAGALLAIPHTSSAQVRQAGAPALSAPLVSARAALDKYKDPLVAVREGYLSSVACIEFPKGAMDGNVEYKPGAMGVHFINMANVGPKLDPAKPQVLIYQPAGDKLRLVAAEWFMPAEIVKSGPKPRIFDKEMQGPMPGHEPIMPAALVHYDLHVWLWEPNPLGVFEPTNSKVSCPKNGYSHFEMPTHGKH